MSPCRLGLALFSAIHDLKVTDSDFVRLQMSARGQPRPRGKGSFWRKAAPEVCNANRRDWRTPLGASYRDEFHLPCGHGGAEAEVAAVDGAYGKGWLLRADRAAGGLGDGAGLTATAKREGDTWILNGQKRWIGNAPWCDVSVSIVWARDERDFARPLGIARQASGGDGLAKDASRRVRGSEYPIMSTPSVLRSPAAPSPASFWKSESVLDITPVQGGEHARHPSRDRNQR